MSLLIDMRNSDWMADTDLAARLAPMLPGVRILTGPRTQPDPDVRMLIVIGLHPDQPGMLPGLQLVQKTGAGVETIVGARDLPDNVRIARLGSGVQADQIAEYCLAYVLAGQRNLFEHLRDQARADWVNRAPKRAGETRVGVLGLGHIGTRIAGRMVANGFAVTGWSRGAKSLPHVDCLQGEDGLATLLRSCDHVISILPATPQTDRLLNADRLAMMKRGATLINVGRGNVLDESALVAALDAGRPGRAVLDVFDAEPLPTGSPLWSHPSVVVTPHVSGWDIGDSLDDIAQNYVRLRDGKSLLHEVDRRAGY